MDWRFDRQAFSPSHCHSQATVASRHQNRFDPPQHSTDLHRWMRADPRHQNV